MTPWRCLAIAVSAHLALAGCGQQMEDQHKVEIFEASDRNLHPPAAPTVSREDDLRAAALHNPFPPTPELFERGKNRFDIFCSPCHGVLGNGAGVVVQRGFPSPPSFHIPRLRNAADRHFYEVISEGFGVMYAYADRVPPADRWAIIAYIRALQLSQHFPAAALERPWPAALAQQQQEPAP